MIYDVYIEKQKVDIDQNISIQLNFGIDDVTAFGSRETSFSRQIAFPGTSRNNQVFGHINMQGSANNYSTSVPNINSNFNPADISLCEVRMNGLLIIKGIFRLTNIIFDKGAYSYDGVIFGELGGFVSAIANNKLEDLDFSQYNHTYNSTNIAASWDTINGESYYYPLIDYGTYSTAKVNYDIRTFRPALYVKEYLDKIFAAAGYTYESAFMDTALFKSLIVPHNAKRLTKLASNILTCTVTNDVLLNVDEELLPFTSVVGSSFTPSLNDDAFTYNQAQSLYVNISFALRCNYSLTGGTTSEQMSVELRVNGVVVDAAIYYGGTGTINKTFTYSTLLNLNDVIDINFVDDSPSKTIDLDITNINATLLVETVPPTVVDVDVDDSVIINETIPKGIFQRDFFSWIVRMFNLHIDEDKLTDKKLLIKTYDEYYDYSNPLNWEQKIDYSKAVQYTPMGNINGRIYDYKYKPDNDFYNEGYQKKFNRSYGDLVYDTGFPFSKNTETIEIGFSPTPLVQYTGADKVVSAIYKKSSGNDIDQEELTDSNIRVLFAKKITGITSWNILDGVSVLSSQSSYGFAGHVDDPDNSTVDLNYGAPSEIFFSPTTYTGNNLFNVYWNDYLQEIINKDSRLFKGNVYLNELDIAELDLSRPVFIGGLLWRISKIEDWDAVNKIARVELLKVING